ncbi:hypothetical protein IEO21_10043 [Rhodonia placenta]|uniref:Uncharacterized protein n=1 Tax=Rhodonia placenta TaxID=104341 RepID=A0A8H7TXN7_9APHY|nr:hypothetical protein IEO21_10043 [Postia placenta]
MPTISRPGDDDPLPISSPFISFLLTPLPPLRTHARTLPSPRQGAEPRRVPNAPARLSSRNAHTRATRISAGALAWASSASPRRRDGFHHRTRRASLHGESANGRTRAHAHVRVPSHPVLCSVRATRAVVSLETHPQGSAQAGVAPGRSSMRRARLAHPPSGRRARMRSARARARVVRTRSPRRVSADDPAPWSGHYSHTALSRASLRHDAVCSAGHALCMSRRLPCGACACTPALVLCGSGQYGRAAPAKRTRRTANTPACERDGT